MPNDPAVDDAARAVLDGTPVNWSDLESSVDLDTRGLTEQLKVLSAVAGVHRAEADGRPTHPLRWGPLEVRELVGSGAFGEVYRAWDTRLDREVALKLLPLGDTPGTEASPVIEEGRLLARVRHPNVATIYGAELIEGRVGLWMEFVHGRTLEALLRAGHQFSRHEVARIGVDVCRAVSAVHAAGLVHRDVTAQNVMLAADGRVVLMDFGAGRHQSQAGQPAAGTPLYLAPEIFRGEPATPGTDIYSIGVLLHHLLTGAYPTTADTMADLRRAHERGERTDLHAVRPDLPPALLHVIERATDAAPAGRYDNCDALAAALAPFAVRRRWLGHPTMAAAAAGILLVGWLGWNAGGRPGLEGVNRVMSQAGIAGVSLVPSGHPVIAVRPFRDLSPESDSDLLVDGMTLEMIRNLAAIDGVDVRSATSSLALKGQDLTLADIGRRLGVTLVLEGAMFRDGDRVRIQVQLAQVGTDTPLWANTFDRRFTDIFAIQDEIARAVVDQLRLKLGAGQRRYDTNPEAMALYLQGIALAGRRNTKDGESAVALFNQVIERDSGFAPAYAGLCLAYGFMSTDFPDVLGMPHQEALALMRSAADTALRLDPLLAEAHAAMGFLHTRQLDTAESWDNADAAFRRAISLNPSFTFAYTTYARSTLLPMGRYEEAEAWLAEAIRRDPESPEVKRELGFLQLTRGEHEAAIDTFRRVLDVDPEFPRVPPLLARAQSLAGRLDEAMPYWESQSSTLGRQHWLAHAYVRAGRRAEIEAMVAVEKHPYRVALFQAALGHTALALDALEQAAVVAPHRTVELLRFPELSALRGHPRFEALRARFYLHDRDP